MSRNLRYLQTDDSDLPDDLDLNFDRRDARRSKAKYRRKPTAEQHFVTQHTQSAPPDGAPTLTYRPGIFEASWLYESLSTFFDQGLITDVLALVRGGKEASVYVCRAHEAVGVPLLAAKVYRPRMFRQMRDDAIYREGREILSESGSLVKKTDSRIMRALGKKSAYGVQVAHTSWLMYEYTTLGRLHQAGIAVPKPYSAASNALLMDYIGALGDPAPTLSQVDLSTSEAKSLWTFTLGQIERMLAHGAIHGDLSAYNLLYWEGTITVIDFPQVTHPDNSLNARTLFERDLARVVEYFTTQGVPDLDSSAIASRLWAKHVRYGAHQRALDEIALNEEP
jgi:RIO kinase 1